MVNMAEKESIRFYNSRTEPSKRAKTVNEAGGGFGKGRAYARRLIKDALNKIIKAKFGLFLIGHSKDKIIKEKDGTEYNMLSCSLTNDYADILLDMADIITFLTVERDIENSQVTSKKVYMNFRSDTVDCGGRFKGLPDKVEYGAKNYLTVFENAVKASTLKPIDLQQVTEEQTAQFEQDADKNIKMMLTLPNIIKDIKSIIKTKLKDKSIDNSVIMNILSKYSIDSPNEIEDIDVANLVLNDFNAA
jgi:hypothetical protein